MTKKYESETMEFLMNYGWVIFIVLLVIAALAYFGVLDPRNLFPSDKNINESDPNFVCSNLEKTTIDGISVYPAITTTKYDLERSWGLKATDIDGSSSKAKQWDVNGVMCSIDVDMCDPLFCLRMQMMVPVNFTEYKEWR